MILVVISWLWMVKELVLRTSIREERQSLGFGVVVMMMVMVVVVVMIVVMIVVVIGSIGRMVGFMMIVVSIMDR